MKPQEKKFWLLFIGVAGIVLSLDHLTKWLITQNLAYGDQFTVVDSVLEIVHWRNFGAAFGFLNNWSSPLRNSFFYITGAIALVVLVMFYKHTPVQDKISRVAYSLIAGGALGNLSDRALRGSVVDFILVHYKNEVWSFSIGSYNLSIPLSWPAFNIADSAITVAIFLILYRSFIKPYPELSSSK